MTKLYKKPRVQDGIWRIQVEKRCDGKIISVRQQVIDGTYQDHYAICIDDKFDRTTEFG